MSLQNTGERKLRMKTHNMLTVIALLTFGYPAIGADEVPASTATEKRIVALEAKCKALEDRIKVLESKLLSVAAHQDKMGNMFAVPTAAVQEKAELLFAYAKDGNATEIKKLLASGQNPNLKDANGMSALMHASENGHTENVRILLEYKANPRQRDKQDRTALQMAEVKGHKDIVALLKEKE